MNILTSLEKQSRFLLFFEGLILIGIIGFVDYLTGNEYAFSVFYVLPILLVTWFTTQRLGLVVSASSAITWLIADVAARQVALFPLIPLWNSLVRFMFFLIITILLSSLKDSLMLARTDHLTSAINSRYFYDIVQMEIIRSQRNQHPFTLVYIDIDDFKAVNDQFGHIVGNQVLNNLVDSIRNIVRKSDFIARLGGDEFAILFPETDQEAARIIFSKIRSDLIEVMRHKNWLITFSAGILTCTVAPHTTDDMIRMADELMYSAKSDGKNKVKYSIYSG